VQVARADEEIQHLGPDHPGVDHVRALVDDPLPQPLGHLGGGEAHVATEAYPELRRLHAGETAEHPGERAPQQVAHLAVHVLAVHAADVVGLEDLHGDGAQKAPLSVS
jgi:hypothetical protein